MHSMTATRETGQILRSYQAAGRLGSAGNDKHDHVYEHERLGSGWGLGFDPPEGANNI